MRVITGLARGRRLGQPPGHTTRPTADRVKEGLFSALQFHIQGRQVLDLFAGTGQLGIECLSRGAAGAVFVDVQRDAAAAVRDNLARCCLEGQVVTADALSFLDTAQGPFDLIFLDPPYDAGLLYPAMERIARRQLLSPHGFLAAEHPAEQALTVPPPLQPGRTYRYGTVAVTLCRREVRP